MLGWDVAEVGIGLFAKSFSNAQGLQRETKPFWAPAHATSCLFSVGFVHQHMSHSTMQGGNNIPSGLRQDFLPQHSCLFGICII